MTLDDFLLAVIYISGLVSITAFIIAYLNPR